MSMYARVLLYEGVESVGIAGSYNSSAFFFEDLVMNDCLPSGEVQLSTSLLHNGLVCTPC